MAVAVMVVVYLTCSCRQKDDVRGDVCLCSQGGQ